MTLPTLPSKSEVTPCSEKNLETIVEQKKAPATEENGGRGGLDPTRFGDWEKNGRCIDF
jgi:hypothetical protein